ncbi:3-keto-disaccharide hydrolase [Flavobacterium sp. W22_SRS_FP1]|uniref:3-keto-disaccharide hydrolase n=1 Tax=Flavobacterium sp. W22_SRS_FP1 TaxID=3240276 RepID=UPI003F90B488
MKSRKISGYFGIVVLFSSTALMAQHTVIDTPPEVSPMAMKPEMTEIWEPEVKIVTPGKKQGEAPSDAIVLFNGKNMDEWVSQNDIEKPAVWKIVDNDYMEVVSGSGGIQTKMQFGDCQLHIEWSAPDVVVDGGQWRGNSGVFFQNRYELQVLDSYNNRTYSNGQAGSIYKDHPPLVNAMKTPLEWNSYDVVYTAPRFKANGLIDAPARITVFHNGVLVQNNATINGLTLYSGLHNYPSSHGEDVISLQEHGCKTQFRNIWIRRL